jgi:hypothetical protein
MPSEDWAPSDALAPVVTEAKERLYAELTDKAGIQAFPGKQWPP